jgi:epoxyqueuosine reductase
MTTELLKLAETLLHERGAGIVGAVDGDKLLEFMNTDRRAVFLAAPDGTDRAPYVICAAFPYFAGFAEGNLSLYARGQDYHKVLGARLRETAEILQSVFPEYLCQEYFDSGVLPEVAAARLSGVAMTGFNGLAICKTYGSFIFLGFIAVYGPDTVDNETDGQHDAGDYQHDAGGCENCGKCVRACPSGALKPDGSVDPALCLSALTQKRGSLTEEEIALLRRGKLIWGCDLCQLACPHNASPRMTEIPEFLNTTPSLCKADLAGLSDREFRRKFQDKAFTWRGLSPLLRNLDLLGDKSETEG